MGRIKNIMALSLDKLHQLLSEKRYVPLTHFTYHGLCRYIEVVSTDNAEQFLLTISSRYEMTCSHGHSLKAIPVDSSGLIPEKYARLPSNFEISNLYEEIGISHGGDGSKDIENRLMEGYKKTIQIDNSTDGNRDAMKENFNQLKRIQQCMNNLEYRAAIFHKVWLSVLNYDNDIECYIVKDYHPDSMKKFLVTVDLERFIQNSGTIPTDIEQINQGITKIMDRNTATHTTQFYTILRGSPVLSEILEKINAKRRKYSEMVGSFRSLLEFSKVKERELIARLGTINPVKEGSIYSDMDKARQRSALERDIQGVIKSRDEIMQNILRIKQRERSLVLNVDRILFDNIVMLSTVNRNLNVLASLSCL